MRTHRGTLLTLAGVCVLLVSGACARRIPAATKSTADSVDIGYGAQRKDKVTGAVSSLSEKDMAVRPLEIEELLRGKVAGLEVLQVGNTVSLRIRGTNSMLVNQEPLVIVDDVMIQEGHIGSALAGLTRDDITSVSVLKDVASTSVYGSRGAGGVVLIKTKAKPRPEQLDQ
jgi:TonB-dependent starch-binding outer membrane protein SusC